MTSSNVLLFPGGSFDIVYETMKFHGHWSSNREVTRGRGIRLPVLPDSERPGLFRVKFSSLKAIGQLRKLWAGSGGVRYENFVPRLFPRI